MGSKKRGDTARQGFSDLDMVEDFEHSTEKMRAEQRSYKHGGVVKDNGVSCKHKRLSIDIPCGQLTHYPSLKPLPPEYHTTCRDCGHAWTMTQEEYDQWIKNINTVKAGL